MQGIVRMNKRERERLKRCIRMSLGRKGNWLEILEGYYKLRKNAEITGRIVKQKFH